MATILAMCAALSIHAIPAFTDNYVWRLARDGRALVVDPGDAAPVLRDLSAGGWTLDSILITHHHPDHIGGLATLAAAYPGVPVFGPRGEAAKIPGLTQLLDEGDEIERERLGLSFRVMAVPGHTLGHIAYWCPREALLFCGDTLFSAGCGRLFEGTPEQMHRSLSRLAALPAETAVYCTHEYTFSNLQFAAAVEPSNPEVTAHIEQVRRLRAAARPSLPSRIALERGINPFLRTDRPEVAAAAAAWSAGRARTPAETFATLRRWKDEFKPAMP